MNVALHAQHIDILSICTGGGGLDLGVELAIPGARSVVLVEREAFAVAQLVSAMEAGLLHQAPVWSDARTFDGLRWRGSVDGLIGGIPCQGHSVAGKKRGSLDERDLWSPARRIIVQARPWFVLIENVGGMLSPGDDDIAGAERVWRDLRKLGFAVEGGLFTASEVGASHERERIFILGVHAGVGQANASSLRRDRPATFAGSARAGAGEGWMLQSSGDSGAVRGVGQADPYRERLEGQRSDAGAIRREDAGRSSGLCDGADMVAGVDQVDASRNGRREGRPEPELQERHGPAPAIAGAPMANTVGGGHDRWQDGTVGGPIERAPSEGAGADCLGQGVGLADTCGDGQQRRSQSDIGAIGPEQQASRRRDAERCNPAIFPPGPHDLDTWRLVLDRAPHLEPAVRRMADGMAARVDRLRMLGNGVVPLQAAYAVRTLATRLADRGSAGATRLVRMMEPT